ncbi:hypothetical protein BANRA_03828 [Klebsiella pneumoniae]|nr:hypothetical protein BANRA_03828 [Klebsiella pneumoniae]
MNFGAVFVLYNPDDEIISKLIRYKEVFSDVNLFFVDNSPSQLLSSCSFIVINTIIMVMLVE